MNPVSIVEGRGPIVLAQPHSGTWLPDPILQALAPGARGMADTDWHIDRLYEGLVPDATIVRANFNRYVIDANRPPDGASLYPGQNTTGLVPVQDFMGQPIWLVEPDPAEIARRLSLYHAPYHAALAAQLERVKALHGQVVLYDCHSIRSPLPFLFEGELPELNVGTNSGQSCAAAIEHAVASACGGAADFTSVVNGRFKGGWTTRHYGRPELGMHAVQMEIVQRTYLEGQQPPFTYSHSKAARLREVLAQVFAGVRAAIGEIA